MLNSLTSAGQNFFARNVPRIPTALTELYHHTGCNQQSEMLFNPYNCPIDFDFKSLEVRVDTKLNDISVTSPNLQIPVMQYCTREKLNSPHPMVTSDFAKLELLPPYQFKVILKGNYYENFSKDFKVKTFWFNYWCDLVMMEIDPCFDNFSEDHQHYWTMAQANFAYASDLLLDGCRWYYAPNVTILKEWAKDPTAHPKVRNNFAKLVYEVGQIDQAKKYVHDLLPRDYAPDYYLLAEIYSQMGYPFVMTPDPAKMPTPDLKTAVELVFEGFKRPQISYLEQAFAWNHLGRMYYCGGNGIMKDVDLAKQYYDKGEEFRNKAFNLGDLPASESVLPSLKKKVRQPLWMVDIEVFHQSLPQNIQLIDP